MKRSKMGSFAKQGHRSSVKVTSLQRVGLIDRIPYDFMIDVFGEDEDETLFGDAKAPR